MTIFKPQQKTSGYNTISDGIAEDETAAVPFGTTVQTSSSTSTSRRSSTWRIAIVAGLTMIVMAGGAILMLQTTDGGLTTTAVASNSDNGLWTCCKKQSDECLKSRKADNDADLVCTPKNPRYEGDCHAGAKQAQSANCCTDADLGTLYLFDFGHQCH